MKEKPLDLSKVPNITFLIIAPPNYPPFNMNMFHGINEARLDIRNILYKLPVLYWVMWEYCSYNIGPNIFGSITCMFLSFALYPGQPMASSWHWNWDIWRCFGRGILISLPGNTEVIMGRGLSLSPLFFVLQTHTQRCVGVWPRQSSCSGKGPVLQAFWGSHWGTSQVREREESAIQMNVTVHNI